MSDMIRVAIVDDQELVRTGFRLILEAEDDIEVVADAADGNAAVDAVNRHRPDVVLMDIQMPVLDGIAATRQVAGSASRVVILTTFQQDDYIIEAVRAGASGFLLKNAPPRSWSTRSGWWRRARRCCHPQSPGRYSPASATTLPTPRPQPSSPS